MKKLRKSLNGISIAIAVAMLTVTGTLTYANPNVDNKNSDSLKTDDPVINEIYFTDQECSDCKFITIINMNDEIVYDKLVKDSKHIKDQKLLKLLDKSDFMMRNYITDYYILSN